MRQMRGGPAFLTQRHVLQGSLERVAHGGLQVSSLTATSGPVAPVLQPSPGPHPEMRGTTPGASCCLQQKALFAVGTSISPNPGGPGGSKDYVLNQMAAVAQNGPITAHFPQRPSMPTALASEGCRKKLPEMVTYRKRNMPSPSSGGHTSDIRTSASSRSL